MLMPFNIHLLTGSSAEERNGGDISKNTAYLHEYNYLYHCKFSSPCPECPVSTVLLRGEIVASYDGYCC